jgi:hypothetical protein
MNPIIKFTTLFGLLAVELAVTLSGEVKYALAAVFFLIAMIFIYRSFYGMRIHRHRAAREIPVQPTETQRVPAPVN